MTPDDPTPPPSSTADDDAFAERRRRRDRRGQTTDRREAPPTQRRKLGTFFLESGLLTQTQLDELLIKQAEGAGGGDLLGALAIKAGWTEPKDLLPLLARQLDNDLLLHHQEKEPLKTAIRLVDIHKTLGGAKVLDGVSLEIPKGKITAIIGISGGGKSVTLKHMIGLMRPDSGEVWVGDREISRLHRRELKEIRQRFSMLFQSSALFDSMNVFDNVAFPLRENSALPEEEIEARVLSRLAEVNLAGKENKWPDDLSGGMMKRVALARAMVTEPEFILLDEPTAGLDPIIENAIHHLICDTYMRSRYTMVFISHAIPEIFNWCHHVVVLHGGKVLASGSSTAIRNSEHPLIRQFINGHLDGPIRVM